MYKEAVRLFSNTDAAILCAAVADFTVKNAATEKIKRKGDELLLQLVPTKDIAAHLGQMKQPGQLLVGFALETTNEKENAQAKLVNKNLDFIILNSLNDPGAGFSCDTNKVTILSANEEKVYPLKTKKEVACDIVEELCKKLG
jgi:phosphopantothenoylcysteine decarboxylase/phosphopantothenate--cysteine ligase